MPTFILDPALPIWLASDIHLAVADDALTQRFLRWLQRAAEEAGAVILLGDIFDAWIGDDDLAAPLAATVVAALQKATAAIPVWVVHGNRDFLLGAGFAAASGVLMCDDPCRLTVAGTPTLLSHGDALCTDDPAYQQFRATVRTPSWHRDFLSRSLQERRGIAAGLRQASELAKRDKSTAIMDVNPQAVADLVRTHQVTRLIHGHTHRPAQHLERADGVCWERWVLPDWSAERGGFLRLDAHGCQFEGC